jgi:hypothetical protein
VAELPFLVFDADNHYYEAQDAFTRHLGPGFEKRCMQWAQIGGRTRLLVGGRVNRFIPNPTFDPVANLADPTSYVDELEGFSDAEIRLVMRENALGLAERRPASAA